jgi:hypothetical protein
MACTCTPAHSKIFHLRNSISLLALVTRNCARINALFVSMRLSVQLGLVGRPHAPHTSPRGGMGLLEAPLTLGQPVKWRVILRGVCAGRCDRRCTLSSSMCHQPAPMYVYVCVRALTNYLLRWRTPVIVSAQLHVSLALIEGHVPLCAYMCVCTCRHARVRVTLSLRRIASD